jgi:hypothetical protein
MLKKQFITIMFASVILANLGHNIIPHHHHIDGILSCRSCNDDNTGRDLLLIGIPNSNCHAFNGIQYYPAPEKQSTGKPFQASKYICLSPINEPKNPIPNQEIYLPLKGSLAAFIHLPGSSIGLRAPPTAS